MEMMGPGKVRNPSSRILDPMSLSRLDEEKVSSTVSTWQTEGSRRSGESIDVPVGVFYEQDAFDGVLARGG